jgi:ribosomal-protein-alanine N-acetyltransferase
VELRLASCTIRDWRKEDAASLARHADSREVWLQLRDLFPHPYTMEHAREWIASAGGRDPMTDFAIVVGDEAVGGIGVRLGEDVGRRSAEIGYWLGEAHWGRGIATEAVNTFSEYAFDAYDLVRLWASVFETNPASCRVLEKAGYVYEGRLRRSVLKAGRTLDGLLYARVRNR